MLSTEERPGLSGGFLFGSNYIYFLDIFDLRTGSLVSSIRGNSNTNESSGSSLEELSWVTDRYFYLPMSSEHDGLLMFDFGPSR